LTSGDPHRRQEITMDRTGIVVTGVDGSPESRAALEFALAEAARRGDRLRVVAAIHLPDHAGRGYGLGSYGTRYESGAIVATMRTAARQMVDEVAAAHADQAANVEISLEVRTGRTADLLIDASEDADLLVLGHRGRGAVASALLGSVGLACALHATCPVTIVRPASNTADTPSVADLDERITDAAVHPLY
jgi:nucleotide-binding universal stress UspA family protein